MRKILSNTLFALAPAAMIYGATLAKADGNTSHLQSANTVALILGSIFFAIVMTVLIATSSDAKGSTSPTVDQKQVRFISVTLLLGWVGLMVLSYWIDSGQPHPSSVAGMVPLNFDATFGPQGMAGSSIHDEFARAMAALPPVEVWQTRASICLAGGILGMALYAAAIRHWGTWNWAAITVLSLAFSFGTYQAGKAIYPVDPWRISCESFTRGAAQGSTLTTGDMRTLELRGCPLPLGFEMDRANRTPTP